MRGRNLFRGVHSEPAWTTHVHQFLDGFLVGGLGQLSMDTGHYASSEFGALERTRSSSKIPKTLYI